MAQGRTTWRIDPEHTAVDFSVKHMMFATVRGRFHEVEGAVHVDEDDPADSCVEVDIDAGSFDTGVAERDRHLLAEDFLDVENHPEITFRSRRVEGAAFEEGKEFEVVGDLTIRDTTKEVVLRSRFEGLGRDPSGGRRAGFDATTEIDRRDWGLRWNRALEAGGILVGNEIRIELDVQVVKEEEATADAD